MMDLSKIWTSLSLPKLLLKTHVGNVLSETFRCERTGSVNDFISFELCSWTLAVAETPDGKLVMVRQFRHGSHKVHLEFPGGCIDAADPDPCAAAIRELQEETGYEGENAQIIGSFNPNPALQFNRCSIVKISNAVRKHEPEPEDTEAMETVLMKPEELMTLVKNGSFDHGIMLDALFFYQISQPHGELKK